MSAPAPIRVVIVDDHDVFRTGLSVMIAEEPGIEVVAQASGGRDGVRLAEQLRPAVVLMDLRMPDLDGIAATGLICAALPETRVLALTMATSREDVNAVLGAGACGFLAKDTPIDSVVAAIRAAAEGAAWLSPLAAHLVLDLVRRRDPAPALTHDPERRLSPRELDVLRLLARGLENDEIARELHISPMTAKTHVSRILAKLGLTSRVQAAVYAVRAGLDGD